MKAYRHFTLIAFSLLFSLNSFSADVQVKIDAAKQVGSYAVGIGSEVTLEAADSKIAGPSIFLGRATHPDGTAAYELYLNKAEQKVFYIKPSHFTVNESSQKVLNPYEQAGGTCTGYAMYGFLQQTHLSGFKGSGILSTKLSTEKGRTTLLVDNVNNYYLTPQHQYSIQGILNKYGKDFGFKCTSYSYKTYEKLRDRVLNQLNAGLPVAISFDLGPKMYPTPIPLTNYDEPSSYIDARLWLPRKIGERNSGGHTIVAAGSFELNNKTYLVTIDSDWNEPRIWDMEESFNTKTAIEEVSVTICK